MAAAAQPKQPSMDYAEVGIYSGGISLDLSSGVIDLADRFFCYLCRLREKVVVIELPNGVDRPNGVERVQLTPNAGTPDIENEVLIADGHSVYLYYNRKITIWSTVGWVNLTSTYQSEGWFNTRPTRLVVPLVGDFFAVCTEMAGTFIISKKTLLAVHTVPNPSHPTGLCFSPDGTRFVIVTDVVTIYQTRNIEIMHCLDLDGRIEMMSFSPNNRYFVSKKVIHNTLLIVDLGSSTGPVGYTIELEGFTVLYINRLSTAVYISDDHSNNLKAVMFDTMALRTLTSSGHRFLFPVGNRYGPRNRDLVRVNGEYPFTIMDAQTGRQRFKLFPTSVGIYCNSICVSESGDYFVLQNKRTNALHFYMFKGQATIDMITMMLAARRRANRAALQWGPGSGRQLLGAVFNDLQRL